MSLSVDGTFTKQSIIIRKSVGLRCSYCQIIQLWFWVQMALFRVFRVRVCVSESWIE